MLSKYEAKEIIKNEKFNWVDHILTIIPAELKSDTAQTVLLIDEAQNLPTGYGNNVFTEIENTVEVQIFYGDDFQFDAETCEIQLMQLFQSKGWQITDSKPHTSDPDTNQITKMFEFTKTKQI